MTYDEIFSSFYPLVTDKDFFNLPEDYAYNLMSGWLHSAVSVPYIRKIFSALYSSDLYFLKLCFATPASFDLTM